MILLAVLALPLLGALVAALFRSICRRCWATGVLLAEAMLVLAAMAGAVSQSSSILGLELTLRPSGGLLVVVACAVSLVGLLAVDAEAADRATDASVLAALAGVALAAMASDGLLGAGLGLGLTAGALAGALVSPRTIGLGRRAARRYLIWLMLAAAALIFAGALDRLAAQPAGLAIDRPDLAGPTAALFVVGIGIGASALPFWAWLPSLAERAPAGAALATGLVGSATAAGLAGALASAAWLLAQSDARPALVVVGGVAALACALLALGAKQPARVVAFLVGANADLALAGLAASPGGEIAGPIWLLAAQALAGALAFAALASDWGHPAGASGRRPLLGLGLAVAALSLVGAPPTAGFVGRILLARSAAGGWFAVDVALTGAIGGLAALRAFLPRYAPSAAPREPPRALDLVALALAAALIVGGLVPEPLLRLLG